MILTKDNLQEWKAKLTEDMMEQYDVPNYGNTLSNHEWITEHMGYDTQEVIDNEVECWDEAS